jgi:hypothetical protein
MEAAVSAVLLLLLCSGEKRGEVNASSASLSSLVTRHCPPWLAFSRISAILLDV